MRLACIIILLFFHSCLFSQVTTPVFYLNPKWAPDGASVVFTSNKEGKLAVYVASFDGSYSKRITDLQYDSGLPDWCRDGKTIVYYRSLENGLLKLFRNDTTGKAEKQLSFANSVDYAVSVSMNKIVFNRREGIESLNHDIYSINTDGEQLQKLTDSKYDYSAPALSPDGKQIVLIRTEAMRKPFKESTQQEIQAVRNSGEIFIMNADGSMMRNLTNDMVANRCPSWSADGKSIYYMEPFKNGTAVYSISLDGNNKQLIHTPAGNTNNFHISTDARYMVYASRREDAFGLYVFDLANQTERKLLP